MRVCREKKFHFLFNNHYLYMSIILQIEYEEIDILCKDNKKWFDLYQFEIPVLHINDKFIMNGHVDEKIMEKELGSI